LRSSKLQNRERKSSGNRRGDGKKEIKEASYRTKRLLRFRKDSSTIPVNELFDKLLIGENKKKELS
jgi:hypothetical protein